ncbi:type II toxin-antitoxin system RelE/ParE family toxin [Glycomyces sp. NPDC047010]|uniref:type II toxin-antitoxin system RelE family toxin n=1 Tax=Glycomyces sp. NPDC047010 TaxID=3155023 RepID=UPI0033E6F661
MSYAVQWEPVVVAQVSRFMATHHGELEELLAFLDLLEEDPRPAGSVAWGPDYRRARVGAWRVLYRIDEVLSVIGIENVGRAE